MLIVGLIKRMVDAALTNVEVVAEPDPVVQDADRLEMYANAAIARIDGAMQMYRVNRMVSQSTLADALLDVRHRLQQGLENRVGGS